MAQTKGKEEYTEGHTNMDSVMRLIIWLKTKYGGMVNYDVRYSKGFIQFSIQVQKFGLSFGSQRTILITDWEKMSSSRGMEYTTLVNGMIEHIDSEIDKFETDQALLHSEKPTRYAVDRVRSLPVQRNPLYKDEIDLLDDSEDIPTEPVPLYGIDRKSTYDKEKEQSIKEQYEQGSTFLTCDTCSEDNCKYRGDAYNIGGDCLAVK